MVLAWNHYENMSKEERIQELTDGQIQMLQTKKYIVYISKNLGNKS